ncbi:LamG-like jellyroll fold domain-containing protein [Pontiella sulfatireligans]|uniref:LamG-like jellyroll fold domain-containing protein n=1 Tax=Pontiella sulfatireligans TaxID=2750658 RepID=A0A6C2URV8_9BACT|nr:LamG-like jellyroll fold domain-containing protein [Pontiella sulfatireligans]VGO21981.1 hypothetical protein SCARR_04061 [Pontiella sulfatireligans]
MRAKSWMIVLMAAGALTVQAGLPSASPTHRFLFNGVVSDAIGDAGATATADTANLEAPQYTSDIPLNTVAGAPTQSMEVGMNNGTKKSGFILDSSAFASAGSMSFWFNSDTLGGGDRLMQDGFRILHENDSSISFFSGGDPVPGARGVAVSAGTWNHAVLTWDNAATTVKAYLNGSLLGTSTSASAVGTSDVRVGGYNLNDNTSNLANQYDGKLYDLQLYDSVLSADDITGLRANPGAPALPASTTVLAHRYEFDNDVTDSGGTVDGVATTSGTYLEAPQFINDIPAGTVAGAPTQSIEFGMNNGSKKSGFSLAAGAFGSAGSMSFWFNSDTIGGGDYLATGDFNILHENDSSISFVCGASIPGARGVAVSAGTWNHAVLTWDNAATTVKAYLNGSLLGTSTNASAVGTHAMRVGTYNLTDTTANLANQYDGRLYDMQIYDGVLYQSDVAKLYLNPGRVYFAEAPAYPEMEEMFGPELIVNGDFASLSGFVNNPVGRDSDLWYVTGSYGDLWIWSEGNATLDDWSFYYADPDNITPLVGTPNVEDLDTATYPLDNTTLLDTWLTGSEVILTSVQNYRNGLKSEDILNGASIDSGATYQFEVRGWTDVDNTNATFTTALTTGADATNTANAVSGSLMEVPIADLNAGAPLTAQLSGADLVAGQINVMFHLENATEIPGVAEGNNTLIRENYRNNDVNSKVWVQSVSLAQLLVAEDGDYNRDGVVDQLDVDLANSYLDGSIDNGPTAAQRQEEKSLEELNLTEFDLNNDGVFDEADIAVLQSLARPVIVSAVMNGSGHFEVEVGSLANGGQYYLMRTTSLDLPFNEQVDSVSDASDTETFTDTNPPAGAAFYKVTD